MAKDAKGPPPAVINHLIDVHTNNGTLDNISNSGIGSSFTPSTTTGISTGYTPTTGYEPVIFDTNHLMVVDASPGTANTQLFATTVFNGNLVFAGILENSWGVVSGGVLAERDTATGTVTSLLSPSDAARGFILDAQAISGNLYFLQYDTFAGGKLGVVSGATGTVTYIPFPESGGALQAPQDFDYYNGSLFFASGVGQLNSHDIWAYNISTTAWTSYDIPGGDSIGGYSFGAAGHYYTFGQASGHTSLYSTDLSTGVTSVAYANVFPGNSDTNDSTFTGLRSDGSNLYLTVWGETSGYDGGQSIIKIDGLSGVASNVFSTSPGFYLGSIADSPGNVFYYVYDGSSHLYDIERITTDSSGNSVATSFDTNFATAPFGTMFNGTLYLGAQTSGNDYDLFKLDQTTGSLNFVAELGTTTAFNGLVPLASFDGSLAVAVDTDGNGRLELWTSSTPDTASSWHQISGTVDIYPQFFSATAAGDYIV